MPTTVVLKPREGFGGEKKRERAVIGPWVKDVAVHYVTAENSTEAPATGSGTACG